MTAPLLVTTQAALDKAIADGITDLIVDAVDGAWLTVNDGSVVAWDSSRVVARGSSHVEAWGSSRVEAGPWVAVRLWSPRVSLTGDGHLIDMTKVDLADPAIWCSYHGVTVTDGIVTVYKAVNDQWTTSRGADYSPGSLPEAADWRADGQCGGGLHYGPTPRHARDYEPDATRYVEVGVRLDEMQPITGSGTAKCKARRVVVACREVTIDGDPV